MCTYDTNYDFGIVLDKNHLAESLNAVCCRPREQNISR